MNYGDKWLLRLCSNGTYYLHKEGELVLLNNGEYVTFDKFNRESAEELISIMNKQSVALSSLMRDSPFLIEEVISNLKKENEELKSKNKILQDKLDVHILLTEDERRKASNHIKKLKDENEELKQQLKECPPKKNDKIFWSPKRVF